MAAEHGRPVLLLAEDDDFQRRVIGKVLDDSDAFTLAAACRDGLEAYDRLCAADRPVDLLLTDIQMPRLDGPALIRAALADRPDLTVVVLSADRDGAMILECLRLGAADYLFKPCAAKTLVDTLLAVLERRGRLGAARPPRVEHDADGWVTITAPTCMEYIARFRDFSERLWFTALPAEDRETMRFVIDELGRNAVEWGNRYDPDKSLALSYRLLSDRLEIRFRDEGGGFAVGEWRDPAEDLRGHVERRRAEGKRPGGFGIALARKLMDEVRFNDVGNEVVAVKRFAPATSLLAAASS